jgi:Bifunctional DNA primase/polymerase, N-terminal
MVQTFPTQQSPIAQAALRYFARGWSVLPLQRGDKRPLIRWETLQEAVCTENPIRIDCRRESPNVGAQ